MICLPTVMLANTRGSLCTKIDDLSVMFNSNRVDIAVLTETWLHNGIMDNLIHIRGYCVHSLDRRDGRQGGGIAVYVRQGLPCSLQPQYQHTSLEVLWLLFRDNIMPREVSHFLIGAVYHPPMIVPAPTMTFYCHISPTGHPPLVQEDLLPNSPSGIVAVFWQT